MIDFKQFKEHVVVPTLKYLDSEIPYSEEAVDLLMMTCAHESRGGTDLRQKGMTGKEGAFGVYQMEMATQDEQPASPLLSDLTYATAMARVHYWRVAEALPSKDDTRYLPLLGEYAKKYYNTHLGKATASKYVMDYLDWRDS